ncbi:23077_t:CDS:2, partial [Gigaspora margarita]
MVKSSISEIILEKITRVFSLLLAIKVALIYAILNSIISAIITGLYMTTDIKLSFKQDFITLVSFIVSLLISARTSNAYNSKVNYDKLRDGILTLTECLSGLEKVDRSIPFAYSTLLSVTTWIFSLSLSFQLVADLQWVTVPIVFFSTLFLFGIIELAKEIENPFGIDVHDLDLDKFCEDIW